MKRLTYYVVGFALLLSSIFMMHQVDAVTTTEPLVINGNYITHYGTNNNVMIPTTYEEQDTEFRGVWVATVYNLNMPQHTSETQYKAAFDNLLDEVEESNMNAIVFQVRSMNDAFYDSQYAPWSRWLTGTEGQDPGWDVMAYMIQEAHARGIEFHAWLNPYRVANTTQTESQYLPTLHEDNFAKQRPDLVISGTLDSSNRYPHILNPGEPEVKTYIRNVVTELMTLYDVDGIHFDDYFYPYSGLSSDGGTYAAYKVGDESIGDWRRENVNDVVRGVKEDVDAYNTANNTMVRFGISPFGLWGSGISGSSRTLPGGSNTSTGNTSSYIDQYADSKKWVEEGWLHYINPQIYWNFQHGTAPYADVVDWWADVVRGTDVDLIIGHAPSSAYQYSWPAQELNDQLRYNQKHPEIVGEMMYSAAYLDYTHMQNVESTSWTTTPLNIWNFSNVDSPSISLSGTDEGTFYSSDVTVTVTGTNDLYYQVNNGPWTPYTDPLVFEQEGDYVVYAKAVDATQEESLLVGTDFTIQKVNNDVPDISMSGDMIESNYLTGSQIVITSNSEPIWVRINFGAVGDWVLYTEPITLNEEGYYFITSKTIDADGVESATTELGVTIQDECYDQPTINVTGTGNDPYYQDATIALSGDSPTIEYKINDGAYEVYTAPFTLDTEGVYQITYRNQDECGTEYTKDIIIDQTAPTEPTLTVDGDYDGERYHTSITSLSLSHLDDTVDLYYRLHNGSSWTEWTVYTEPIVLQFNNTYTFEYKTIDQAQNSSDVFYERIRLQIPPTEDNLYVIRDGEQVTYYQTNIPIELPTEYTEKTAEIRAVWVATVSNIDIKQHSSEADYKAAIILMLDEIERNNFNVMFFQVRPMNDAFYDSEYAPWSRYLTGIEGQDPGWDVFGFIIEEAHKRGIEVHAWLNPYRVSTGTDSKSAQLALLDDDNFAKQNPDLVMQDGAGKLILNPGEPQVQAYIKNVIQELITKYDVDGVHFDDYFYSYNGTPTSEDASAYSKYGNGMTLDDWRRNNIDVIVEDIYNIVQQYNTNNSDHVKFGISPFGIWKSGGTDGSNTSPYALQSYSDQYADTKKWVEEGWLDYILPQLYWEFDHSAAPFADLVDWWAGVAEGTGVDVIIGHGFYRYDEDTWDNESELLEQLRYISKYDVIIGSSFFSYKTLNSLDQEVVQAKDRLNNYYWTEYATFPWESTVEKEVPLVCDDGFHEEDGECVPDPLVCDDGYHEENGECIPDPLVCDDGYHEEDGECVVDVVTCDDGYENIDGECIPVEEPKTGCFSGLSLQPILAIVLTSLLGVILIVMRKGSQ